MNKKLSALLAIDQGSSSTKAMLLSNKGEYIFESSIKVATQEPQTHFVEQDATEIIESVKATFEQAQSFALKENVEILSFGLSCQRSCVLAWDENGKPLAPVISWRDTRTSSAIDKLGDKKKRIFELTGLPAVPNYAGGKIALYQKEFPKAFVATLDCYIRYVLTGQVLMEDTMAARTMLYDLNKANWSPELCDLFGVDSSQLPPIKSSFSNYGQYKNIPLAMSLGDQQAAYQAVRNDGVLLVLGTVASTLLPTNSEIIRRNGFIASVLCTAEQEGLRSRTHYLEATAHCSGPSMDVVFNKKKIFADVDQANEKLNLETLDFDWPVVYLPYGGTGAPEWQENLAFLSEKEFSYSDLQLAAAVFENLAYFVADDYEQLAEAEQRQKEVYITGGASQINYVTQVIATIINKPVAKLLTTQGSAQGILSALAKRTAGFVLVEDLGQLQSPIKNEKILQRFERWHELKDQSLSGNLSKATPVAAQFLVF